ncbi:hypothetical protein [Neorhizobium sp. JUb45]|uniref:hypothetical protein n=1 Tax=unclassified Neorhizobium TaxID=2629175 RepID=UPI0010DA091C|nr:hypothetical protein [Neorhizobium sp. JUb45]TCR03075.1 hypothetical protein EDF70_103503 [Neorhizobium sp. JUb45]
MAPIVILRKWTARIRTADEADYVRYVADTGGDDFHKTQGNLGHQIIVRELGDGVSEVSALSWWSSMDAIRAFAGDNPELARYYPEDDRYLLDRPEFVEHYRVMSYSALLDNH